MEIERGRLVKGSLVASVIGLVLWLLMFALIDMVFGQGFRFADPGKDKWTTEDKFVHGLGSYVLCDVLDKKYSKGTAAGLTFVAALGWEVKDGFLYYEKSGFWGGDGFSYKDLTWDCGGIALKLVVDWIKPSNSVKQGEQKAWARWALVTSGIVGLALQGSADAKTYTPAWEWHTLSAFARNDEWYLGARNGLLVAMPVFASNVKYESQSRMWKDMGGVILLGSAAWDMVFSLEKYGEPFHAMPGWYVLPNKRKIGFSKDGMMVLNVSRIVCGLLLLTR